MATPKVQLDPKTLLTSSMAPTTGLIPTASDLRKLTTDTSVLKPQTQAKTAPINFTLPPKGAPATPGTPLVSASSIPMPGQDSLPDNFDDLKQQLGMEKKPGILASIAKGVGDIALQPARALEQLGKFLGTLGMTPEQKKKVDDYLGPGLQERVLGADYKTNTPETGREAAGIALQSAANLSVPFGTSLPVAAAQGAAYAGGKALEEGRSNSEVAFDAALGGAGAAAFGQLLNVGGAVIGRGFKAVIPEIQKAFKPVAEKIGPILTGTTRQEFDTAFKTSPHILVDYLNVIKNSTSPAEAEGVLQSRLLENVRSIADKAKNAEGTAFRESVEAFNTKHPDVTVDVHAVGNRVLEDLPKFGLPRTQDEAFALSQVQKIIQAPREYSVNGVRTLLTDLFDFASGLDSGSSAERLAMKAWKDVREELTKAVKAVGKDGDLFEEAMARYSNFKDVIGELKPALNEATREDMARSFVRNLAGSNKTASREALIELEKMAGVKGPGSAEAVDTIQIYNLIKRLVATGKVTGSRVQDVLISGGAIGGLGSVGGAFLGPVGAGLGQLLGSLVAIKALSPSTITSIMLSEMKAAGIPITSAVRKSLEEAIKNPATRQSIINATVDRVSESKKPLE